MTPPSTSTETPNHPAVRRGVPARDAPLSHPPRRRRRRRWLVVNASVLSIGLAIPLLTTRDLRELPPPLAIRVQGQVHYRPPGVTFLDMVNRLSLRPRSGSLVDVEGIVLRAGVYPGSILLDGRPVTGDPPLRDGDRLWVVDGKDRTEPVTKRSVRIPGGRPPNPQFSLGIAPGEQVITRGLYSGKLVSSVFTPTAPADVPRAVALTFDDGPWPDQTARLLAVLDRLHVKATFFLVGYLAQRYPDLVRAELADGMEVANHTWDHPYHPPFRDLPEETLRSEIDSTREILANLGARTSLFRPPGGTWDDATLGVASALGYRVVLWSVDPKDWEPGRTVKQIVRAVLSNVHAGAIVELHDGGGDRAATIKAIPAIVRGIRARGLALTTIGD